MELECIADSSRGFEEGAVLYGRILKVYGDARGACMS